MRYFYKLIFLSFFICSINLVVSDEVKSEECVVVGGVITEASANNGCQSEPSGYGIVAYKLYLCTAAPTAPTTTTVTDLESCVIVFEEENGSSVTLSTGASVNLGGTQSLPPAGVYTHGVMHMNNTFAITAKKEFAVAYNGQEGGNGVVCVTVDGAGISGSAEESNDRTRCGDSTLTAGTYTESLTSFDNPFNATATENNVAGTGANITAYLIDTNEFLAVNDADVNNLLGVVEFASAANITESTTNVEISFNVGEGMSIDGDGITGDMYMGSGPFQATISTN
jgi:hypothetical protein